MKMKLTTDNIGRVTISYDDAWYGDRVTREFSTGYTEGGYVIEIFPNGSSTQVCDRLARTGNTLYCASRADLAALIRREYRAMRRAEVAA